MSKEKVTIDSTTYDELLKKAHLYDEFINKMFEGATLYTTPEGVTTGTRLYFNGTAVGNWLFTMANDQYIKKLKELNNE